MKTKQSKTKRNNNKQIYKEKWMWGRGYERMDGKFVVGGWKETEVLKENMCDDGSLKVQWHWHETEKSQAN